MIKDTPCIAPGISVQKLQLDETDSEFVHKSPAFVHAIFIRITHPENDLKPFQIGPSIPRFCLYNLWVSEMLERQNGRECNVPCSTPSDHRDP